MYILICRKRLIRQGRGRRIAEKNLNKSKGLTPALVNQVSNKHTITKVVGCSTIYHLGIDIGAKSMVNYLVHLFHTFTKPLENVAQFTALTGLL